MIIDRDNLYLYRHNRCRTSMLVTPVGREDVLLSALGAADPGSFFGGWELMRLS